MVKEFSVSSSPDIIGGKAHSLSILIEHDFPVPDGFVVTVNDYQYFLEENNINESIVGQLSRLNMSNYKEKSKKTRELILDGSLPQELTGEMGKYLKELGADTVSVRSSATGEDSVGSSFAGQHDSYLNIPSTPEKVAQKVKRCFASGFNEHAIFYRLRQGLPLKNEMAVVIQQMIDAEVAGTVFTANPDTEDRDQIVIESTWGLGEALVSGAITPDRFVVTKNEERIIRRKLGSKEQSVQPAAEGVVVSETERYNSGSYSLEDKTVQQIAKTAKEIEDVFGRPQDIEWCKSGSKIWILQSRPITTL